MKRVSLEYGHGVLDADLPDDAEIFVPGETVPDPPVLQDPVAATRAALLNPLEMPPITRLVTKCSKVAIIFPDRVKGGWQADSHRKVAIPLVISSCLAAGVEKKNIKLICSNGLHRKCTDNELRALLGDPVYREFMPTYQIVNHDSEDGDNLVDLGCDELNDRVIVNREVVESDLAVLIGHVLGNPYGGYSGGYKHCATGITNWQTIASTHNPEVMHCGDFIPVNYRSLMRMRFDAIGRHMEERMGKKFFVCDAVLDSHQRQIAVFAGYARGVQEASWQVADERTFIPWAEEKFDILLFGMPQEFHYGNGHGTNPILIMQAIAANIIRHKRVLRDNAVVVCASLCNGYFHDEEFTGYRELFELYQRDYHHTLPDCARYAEYFARNKEFVDRYRYKYGYHPFHAFSMIACGHIAERYCAAIYLVGAQEPGYARAMGMKTRASFAEALEDAGRYVGPHPRILALPLTFKLAGVHLMMKDEPLPSSESS